MPAATEFEALPETDDHAGGRKLNQGEMAQVMLDAHEDLIRADERNREKFAGVTNVLREQMGRKHAEEKSNE